MKEMIERELGRIEIPAELHERCAVGAHRAKREQSGEKLRRMTAVAAVLVCVMTLSHPTVADGIRGFFEDITGPGGAVTGTAYTPGVGELRLRVPEGGKFLEILFAHQGETPSGEAEPLAAGAQILPYGKSGHIAAGVRMLPFDEIERFAVEARILCGDGAETAVTGEAEIVGGTACLLLPHLPAGEYTLIIDSLAGLSKAEAPLEIRGEWEIEFTAE